MKTTEAIKKGTQEERKRLNAAGMKELSPQEAKNILNDLGFNINEEMSLKYINTSNEIIYKAKSASIYDTETKKSFAHTDFIKAQPTRLKQVQEFRRDHFAYDTKTATIWDF